MSEPNLNLELEQEKERILKDLFKTGRIDGLYFGRTSKTKLNPLKAYISMALNKTFLLNTSGVQNTNEFLSDIHQELFVELSRMPAEKLVNLYNTGKVKGSRLIATALRIIILKCFTRSPSGNPNHSFLTKISFGSVFNAANCSIAPIEIRDDEDPELIVYDIEEATDFEDQYGFTPEEIINLMTPEERFVFEKLLGKQKKGSPSKADKEEKAQFFETVKKLKAKIEKQKGLDNDR